MKYARDDNSRFHPSSCPENTSAGQTLYLTISESPAGISGCSEVVFNWCLNRLISARHINAVSPLWIKTLQSTVLVIALHINYHDCSPNFFESQPWKIQIPLNIFVKISVDIKNVIVFTVTSHMLWKSSRFLVLHLLYSIPCTMSFLFWFL